MHSGIKLGNELFVPILLKSHEILDMFALTCINNLLEQRIIGLFHTPPVHTLCLNGNLPIPQNHRLIKLLLLQSVKSGISGGLWLWIGINASPPFHLSCHSFSIIINTFLGAKSDRPLYNRISEIFFPFLTFLFFLIVSSSLLFSWTGVFPCLFSTL